MTFRSVLVLTAAVSIVGVAACSTENDGSVPDLENETVELNGKGDPRPDFRCRCGARGPNGGYLTVRTSDGQCVEQTKKCCGTTTCPPSRFISIYNPCPSSLPYYRCNVYGDCWCSSVP